MVSIAAATEAPSTPVSLNAADAAAVARSTEDIPRYPGSSRRSVNWPTPTRTGVRGPTAPVTGTAPCASQAPHPVRHRPRRISRASSAVADGVLPTFTPAASSASCLAAAVPDDPETMAPAWPMVLPSGAVKPAT